MSDSARSLLCVLLKVVRADRCFSCLVYFFPLQTHSIYYSIALYCISTFLFSITPAVHAAFKFFLSFLDRCFGGIVPSFIIHSSFFSPFFFFFSTFLCTHIGVNQDETLVFNGVYTVYSWNVAGKTKQKKKKKTKIPAFFSLHLFLSDTHSNNVLYVLSTLSCTIMSVQDSESASQPGPFIYSILFVA